MADDLVIALAGGATVPVRTDELAGGVHVQRVKVGHGPDGAYGDAAPDNGLPTTPGYLEVAGTLAGAVDAFAAQDVGRYRWAQVFITGTYSGTIRFAHSPDGVNWYYAQGWQVNAPANVPTNAPAAGLWAVPLNTRYFKVTATAWSSGTASIVAGFSATPSAPPGPLAVHNSGGLPLAVERWLNGVATPSATAANGGNSSAVPASGVLGHDGTNYRRLKTTAAGALQVSPDVAAGAALSNVTAVATSAALLAANTARRGVVLVNDSTATLFLAYAATASATAYTYKLGPGYTWEMPGPAYTGALSGIWDAANGAARITELT